METIEIQLTSIFDYYSNTLNRFYRGDYPDYLIVYRYLEYGQKNLVDKSNFMVLSKRLKRINEDDVVEQELGFLTINPNNKELVDKATSFLVKIHKYPLLDEFHYSDLEHQELLKFIQNFTDDDIKYYQDKVNENPDEYEDIEDYIRCYGFHLQ